MIYFVGAFALWQLNASGSWWAAYFVVIAIELALIVYNSYKEVKQYPSVLLKANGQPYTQEDLEFIWKHGYQSAVEVINSTKQ